MIWLARTALLVLFMVAGAGLAWAGSTFVKGWQAQAQIERTTGRLQLRIDEIFEEVDGLFNELQAPADHLCTDPHLTELRSRLLSARFVRDIGVLRNQGLRCTTSLGRLEQDVRRNGAVSTTSHGYVLRTVQNTTSAGLPRSVILERQNFHAVMDPAAVTDLASAWDDAFIYLTSSQVLSETGEDETRWFSLRDTSVLSGQAFHVEDSRWLKHRSCSPASELCVGLWVPRQTLQSKTLAELILSTVLGSVGGLGLLFIGGILFRRQQSMEQRLRRALHKGRLDTVYQPIVSIPNGEVKGVEALARWRDDRGRSVPAEEFVCLAENKGMISKITELMIQNVARDLGRWLKLHPEMYVNINIAAADLQDDRLERWLKSLMASTGILPNQINLELTERSIASGEDMKRRLAALASRGFRIYVDDFGVGYCGLAYLHEMQVHGLKVSKIFTDAVGSGSLQAGLVPHILKLADELRLDVVVEGVERLEQAEALASMGEMHCQGWLYSRALKPRRIASLPTRLRPHGPYSPMTRRRRTRRTANVPASC